MTKYSQSNNSLFLNVYAEQKSQDVAGNTSTVSWKITVSRTGGYYTYNHMGDSRLSLSLDGKQVHSSNPKWQTSGEEFVLASGSSVVSHQQDGQKTVPISATFVPNNGIHGTITVSAKLALTTIPRASSVSAGSGVIGSSLAITINRQSNSFTHTLRYAWGGKSGTIASNVGASHSWTIPNDFANDIPNSTSGTGTLFVDTYSGGTKIGTQQINFTASVPASIKPTFSSVTLTDTNGVARGLLSGNNFLQVISDIQVTFNGAAGSYGSTITGYRAEIVNRNQVTTSNGGRLGMMNFNGSATIRASVVDSRGRWSDTRDVTINVLEYFAPVLSFTAIRTRETPNIIQIVRNAKIAPMILSGGQKNVMTLTFKVAPLGSTSYTADNGSATGTFTTQHTLTNSAANMAGNYPANKSFIVIGTLADKFTSIEFSATVATESVVMSYDKDGRVGIGKVVEQGKAGSLDVAGDIYAGGLPIQQYQLSSNDGYSNVISEHPDTLKKTGFYYLLNGSGRPNNRNGYLRVQAYSNLYIMQEYTDVFDGKRLIRVCNNGNWTAWTAPGLNQFYPVGSIYQSTNNANPSTFMGGTWERFGNGKVLVGVNESDADFNTVNKTGGSKTTTNLALSGVGFGGLSGGNKGGDYNGQVFVTANSDKATTNGRQAKPQSIMPPYVTVYMWRRIA